MSTHLTLAQEVNYKLIERNSERSQVRIDTFNIHLKTELYDGIYWVQAIEPRWNNVAGILKDSHFELYFRDSISDGLLRYSYFYQSAADSENFIIVAVHGFDDGLSGLLFFEYQNGKVEFLDRISLFTKKENDPFLGGYFGIYPKAEMTISKNLDKLRLHFINGEYIYWSNYKEQILTGPIDFFYDGEKFVLDD